ncbi:MAG: alcohol dehydrogenase catalytic domain-containing protein [Candidatus Aenigmarchaeota archaeon]|nr:alcohol dehydrogenase catalytic domain-containing protein [Candidatus Aenigmarchaeota archaeon]
MKAALLEGPKNIRVADIPKPAAGKGVLLRVRACGICGSDMKFYNYGDRVKKFPQILGHEVAGEVVEVGSGVDSLAVGDRIALRNEVQCGRCPACLKGLENVCENIEDVIGVTIPGGLAEYMLLTEEIIEKGLANKMPEKMAYEEGALAEPLGCVVNGLEFARMEEGKSVLVIGAGPIGCMIINLARIMGASEIVVVDKNQKRLDMARPFGADHYVYGENFLDDVLGLSKGGYDVVMSACSDSKAHEKAILAAGRGGFVNLFGGIAKGLDDAVSFPNNFIHYRQCSVGGTFSQTRHHHKRALQYLAAGKIKAGEIITHKFGLDEAEKAIKTVQNQECLKVMVLP